MGKLFKSQDNKSFCFLRPLISLFTAWLTLSRRHIFLFSHRRISWLLHGGAYFTDLADFRASPPTSLIGLRCLWRHHREDLLWTHPAVCCADASEDGRAVRRRRGDPRLYKRRISPWAGAVRHSDPAEAGSPDIESAAKIAFQKEGHNITRRL